MMKRRTKITVWTLVGATIGAFVGFLPPALHRPQRTLLIDIFDWPARRIGWFMARVFAGGENTDAGMALCFFTIILCYLVIGAVLGLLVSRRFTTKSKDKRDG